MSRIATSIEQSKKLIELGIDINTADMHYYIRPEYKGNAVPCAGYDKQEAEWMISKQIAYYTPAWSFSALLELMPSEIKDGYFLTLDKDNTEYCCYYKDINGNSFKPYFFKNTPIDAAFEMVCWLLKNKII